MKIVNQTVKHVIMFISTAALMLTVMNASAQENISVKGKILDAEGETLGGVTVLLKGTTKGVLSNETGDYQISDVPKGGIIEFRLMGFVTVEKEITGTNLNVVMMSSSESLEELTIVAFAQQKKESVIASIATVNPSELKVPSSNLTTALAGRIAGLVSYQRSGEPGRDNAEFFVRGVTTFGYKKDPLILIDNNEVTTQELSRMQPEDRKSVV